MERHTVSFPELGIERTVEAGSPAQAAERLVEDLVYELQLNAHDEGPHRILVGDQEFTVTLEVVPQALAIAAR